MKTLPKDKVYEMLRGFSSTMLVTYAGDGSGHARPMEIAFVDEHCGTWFFTARTSGKTEEIRQDQRVLLTFQKDHREYLSITGAAELITDRERMRELWTDDFKVWFPGGVDDPELTMIRVRAMEAEYWDASGMQGMRYLFEAIKARIKGEKPDVDTPEMHGEVSLAEF